MSIKEKALANHDKGYNCAQGVFNACAEYTGLDEKLALAIAGPFGGGMRCGEMCGAVSGALMAVGYCCPYNDCTNLEAKDKIAALAIEVTSEFKAKIGHLRCEEIKASEVTCNECIACGAEIAEKVILANK